MSGLPTGRPSLLILYKQLLRSCETYPSKNRMGIYQAIREEWKENKDLTHKDKLDKQIAIAYKGLSQLRQFDEMAMSGGRPASSNWSVTMEQNPMPKPDDYDSRKTRRT
ncbi:predicted protein [Phaeodactylum tricornutum CCAP 1055/1]|jgi:hypothetical protein|uniref:Complex 1 LYR protein domain-containing protein n=1 Tax=Phaeodactylum tricornutum (strain CCAP 1055/1) TaxID=556484 RepID=B7FVD6_PHATC|nr:predicted protein [Phaeodactylum tricornutum CCAP 1055/1]EEC49609.1 predicted protein [Phaeodactylum tricornutum CCAP 1055/1]|eukprot:XP_002178911.1 predicted protein [Phaeodactylum tricornutum CCAP 1055/1]